MVHIVDTHVGKMIRQRRWLVGMTQQELAEIVGIRFQQIQKYETGANRVSASRLWDIANALEVTVSTFFEGVPRSEAEEAEQSFSMTLDKIDEKEALALVRSYYQIPKGERRRLVDLARVLSNVA